MKIPGLLWSCSLNALLLLPIYQSGYRLFHFMINQNQIVTEHCINQAVPGSTCQGMCYLSKLLKEQKTADNPFRETDRSYHWEFVPLHATLAEQMLTVPSAITNPLAVKDVLSQLFVSGLFRPPKSFGTISR